MYEKLYHDLLNRYNDLECEYTKLSEENEQLRQRLGFSKNPEESIVIPVMEAASVNKYSSPKEEIDLFRSLFCGREDVFARRWHSVTSGKSGYQPVCENEWAEGLCDKENSSVQTAQIGC